MQKIKNYFWSIALAVLPGSAMAFTSEVFNDKKCANYEQWISEVWKWGLGILIPLSVLILSAAGVLYMVSGGDPKRVETSKKMIIGVLSGVGLIILARFLLVNVIGLEGGTVWNVTSSCK